MHPLLMRCVKIRIRIQTPCGRTRVRARYALNWSDVRETRSTRGQVRHPWIHGARGSEVRCVIRGSRCTRVRGQVRHPWIHGARGSEVRCVIRGFTTVHAGQSSEVRCVIRGFTVHAGQRSGASSVDHGARSNQSTAVSAPPRSDHGVSVRAAVRPRQHQSKSEVGKERKRVARSRARLENPVRRQGSSGFEPRNARRSQKSFPLSHSRILRAGQLGCYIWGGEAAARAPWRDDTRRPWGQPLVREA